MPKRAILSCILLTAYVVAVACTPFASAPGGVDVATSDAGVEASRDASSPSTVCNAADADHFCDNFDGDEDAFDGWSVVVAGGGQIEPRAPTQTLHRVPCLVR